MKRIANIGSLLKKIYRAYSVEIIKELVSRGFNDLRPSFLEILMYLSENDAPSIKLIGKSCGLKKQTMTSHLNELEKRGYIKRTNSEQDKREQLVTLTDYGEKFKLNLLQVTNDLEREYTQKLGEVELDRVELMLDNLYRELMDNQKKGSLI
ncbi:MAG TPA: MarR family transcriptional regulator [Bacteriovoracaceae bacterium]|nr:MarR family transcriptional regulator [Bacteriovoracaceae bacterium]